MKNIQIGTVKNPISFKSNRDRGGRIRHVRVTNLTTRNTLKTSA